jgi:hypothetical protein
VQNRLQKNGDAKVSDCIATNYSPACVCNFRGSDFCITPLLEGGGQEPKSKPRMPTFAAALCAQFPSLDFAQPLPKLSKTQPVYRRPDMTHLYTRTKFPSSPQLGEGRGKVDRECPGNSGRSLPFRFCLSASTPATVNSIWYTPWRRNNEAATGRGDYTKADSDDSS